MAHADKTIMESEYHKNSLFTCIKMEWNPLCIGKSMLIKSNDQKVNTTLENILKW